MEFRVSKEGLQDFASQFWEHCKDHRVFAFHGEMGAGKTTIISVLCLHLGISDHPSSPTFSIINEYRTATNDSLYHIDLYRLRSEAECRSAGVEDCIDSGEVCFVEWPERAPALFDDRTVHVFIKTLSASERSVDVNLPAAAQASVAEQS